MSRRDHPSLCPGSSPLPDGLLAPPPPHLCRVQQCPAYGAASASHPSHSLPAGRAPATERDDPQGQTCPGSTQSRVPANGRLPRGHRGRDAEWKTSVERPGRGPEVPRLRACPVTPPLQTAEGTHVSRRTRSLAAVGPGAMDRTSPSQIHMLRPSPPRDSSGDGARRRSWRLESHTVGPDPQRWCLVRGRDERKPAVCHVRTWARAAVGEGSRGRAGRERAPPGTESARTLVPDFGLHDCDSAHPVCGVLLWWPELTETPGAS